MPDQTDRKHNIYGSPREAALLFLLPGIIQGLALYGLVELAGEDINSPLLIAGFIFALVAPSAHFLTSTKATRIPSALFSIILGAATALLYMLAEAAFGDPGEITPQVLLVSVWANLVICYIAPPFFRTVFERRARVNHYPSLFEFAWNLPVITISAGLFTLAVWAVLGIWAALFNLISIDFFADLFFDESFALPATFGASAVAIGIVREREGIVLALRNVLFALLRVLSPVLMAATLLFAVSALVQGLDKLWDGWSAASLMVSAIVAAIVFSNAVIGEEGRPENFALRWSVRLQSWVLPLLAAFALYAMYLRLSEYGLTVARIYALILVLFAAAYAVVWFISTLLSSGYGFLRQANIWLAGALFVVAVLVQTPVLNTWQMTADDQIARLKDGRLDAETFDYAYFQFELGKVGKTALANLKTDETLPAREKILGQIARVEAAENRYGFRREVVRDEDRFEAAIADGRLTLVPENTILDLSFVVYAEQEGLLQYECRDTDEAECILLETRIFESDTPQYVLFMGYPRANNVNIRLLFQNNGGWQQAFGDYLELSTKEAYEDFLERIKDGDITAGTITFRTMKIGDQQIYFLNNDKNLRELMEVSASQD